MNTLPPSHRNAEPALGGPGPRKLPSFWFRAQDARQGRINGPDIAQKQRNRFRRQPGETELERWRAVRAAYDCAVIFDGSEIERRMEEAPVALEIASQAQHQVVLCLLPQQPRFGPGKEAGGI